MSAQERHRTEQGYTLMEVVAASVPLALIGLLLFAAFSFTVSFSRRREATMEAVQQARTALHLIARDLRETSAAPGAIIIWSREEGAPQDGLGFLTPRVDEPGRPFLTDADGTPRWNHAVYYLHDPILDELRRVTGESTALAPPPRWVKGQILAHQVSRLRAARQRDLVTITLTVRGPTGETTVETAVRPRN